ncbi:hypothetical protein SD80_019435 [Scytonema tolypothrichoides VB-61278]|nr:hypothetical protein SD80_019435 [Scytonema tolypothrichoides VB-61278]
MLPTYGLSCRLQRLAFIKDAQEREQLLLASAFNAETSHEDLGLEYEGVTHTALYRRFGKQLFRKLSMAIR